MSPGAQRRRLAAAGSATATPANGSPWVWVDGRPCDRRVRVAMGFASRAIGLLQGRRAGDAEVLLIPRCAAVHTLGMRRCIDLAFVAADGRVLRTVHRLAPWRFAACRDAASSWEFDAGDLERLGIVVGSSLSLAGQVVAGRGDDDVGNAADASGNCDPEVGSRRDRSPERARDAAAWRRRCGGAALIEFLLAGVLVLLPLTFATLELAQLAVARHALDYAAFEAARAGAVNGASRVAMRRALGRALVPLFAPVDAVGILRGSREAAPGGAVAAGATALARAMGEVFRPDLLRLDLENPTPAAVRDFAVLVDGVPAIPNDGLELRNPFGAASGQTLREANVLAIRVRYCRRLVMPVTERVVPALLRFVLLDPFDQLCLAEGRVPIDVAAVVHMQSPARVSEIDGG